MGKTYTNKEDFEKSLLPKPEKTIKVKTLMTGIAVALALVASFIGGIWVSNHYTDTIHAQAVELSKHLNGK